MMDIEKLIADFRREWNSESEYVEAHTSGSTGAPKPIRLLKADMRASARATVDFFGLSADSRIAAALSPQYIAGKMMIVRAEVSGAALVAVGVERCPDLEGAVPLDLLAIVPAQIEGLLGGEDLRGVRNVLIGGAPMTPAQREAVVRSGVCAWESYGMTETCSHVALRRVSEEGDRPFEAMPGIRFGLDGRGCLRVISEAFSWKELTTNDCVELLDERHFLWRGRYDNVIISGGLKLHPELLEKEYEPALGGREYYVCGREDAQWGCVAVLVVQGDGDAGALMKRLEGAVRERRHLPKEILFVREVPRTANGKIIRRYPKESV